MIERQIEIINRLGMHARAAAKLVSLSERFSACVTVVRNGESVPACSIMGLMMLGAAKGDTITISAQGDNAAQVVDTMCALVEEKFGED